jgi:hypothetical protein
VPVIAEVEQLLDRLGRLIGQAIAIEESISRDRARGHDRHWSTQSLIEIVVQAIRGTISGAQIILDGGSVWYAISADAIASVTFEPDLVIAERFEQCTERRTTIRLVHAASDPEGE